MGHLSNRISRARVRIVAFAAITALLACCLTAQPAKAECTAHAIAETPANAAVLIQPRSEFADVMHTYWNYICDDGICSQYYFNPSYIMLTFQNGYEIVRLAPVYTEYLLAYGNCTHGGTLQMWQYTYRLF